MVPAGWWGYCPGSTRLRSSLQTVVPKEFFLDDLSQCWAGGEMCHAARFPWRSLKGS